MIYIYNDQNIFKNVPDYGITGTNFLGGPKSLNHDPHKNVFAE